jgi:hypothetical protein
VIAVKNSHFQKSRKNDLFNLLLTDDKKEGVCLSLRNDEALGQCVCKAA